MTKDIIVEFSCSLNQDGTFKQYHVVAGSIFREQYNETLDNATIVLAAVKKEDRLYKIKPYDFCHVFDAADPNFDHTYLVDNFHEAEVNINEHIFEYTINLMSMTKLLEKIQCPNLSITHKIENGKINKRTIFEYICRYMELFCPKVKMYNEDTQKWEYKPIIKWNAVKDTTNPLFNRFNVNSADLSFSAPTLRQLLTTLMQQVGCIPTVNSNRELSFLDFQIEAKPFGVLNKETNKIDYTINNTVNKIERSLSSDSYANNLVKMADNVIETKNKVIAETIGFRDKDNVLLKQTSNLSLQTRFPIYKVESFKIYANSYSYMTFEEALAQTWQGNFDPLGVNACFKIIHANEDNVLRIIGYNSVMLNGVNGNYGFTWQIRNFKIHCCQVTEKNTYHAEDRIKEIGVLTPKNSSIFTPTYGSQYNIKKFLNGLEVLNIIDYLFLTVLNANDSEVGGASAYIKSNEIDISQCNLFWLESEAIIPYEIAVLGNDEYKYRIKDVYPHGQESLEGLVRWKTFSYTNYDYCKALGCEKIDITDLIVENKARSCLSTNYKLMNSSNLSTLKELSKYIYGTVGYTIGSKEISGFSQMYSVLSWSGLWEKEYTYIENITNFIKTRNIRGEEPTIIAREIPPGYPKEYKVTKYGNIVFPTNFSFNVFDIVYQPLNSFNLSFIKENKDIPYLIEQFSGGDSAMSDFDRLSISEQEQVNRIGNETLNISQRTTDFSDIQMFNDGPLYFQDDLNRDNDFYDELEDDKYVIFQRTFDVQDYAYQVSYVGSKDSILKNYFTSIRTKYRAYQFVDYSQSTIRKERDVIFVRIGEDWINGDDKIYGLDDSLLISGFLEEQKKDSAIKFSYEKGIGIEENQANGKVDTKKVQSVKNEVSMIANDNSFALIYENYDNVSAGIQLVSDEVDDRLGGVRQKWQIWEEDTFSEKHEIGFLNNYDPFANWKDYGLFLFPKNPFIIDYEKFISFKIVDDNKTTVESDLKRTFYKDGAEIINHTTQFVYYSTSDKVKWTEYFISNNGLLQNPEFEAEFVVLSDDFNVNKNEHDLGEGETLLGYRENSIDAEQYTPYYNLTGSPMIIKVKFRDESYVDGLSAMNLVVHSISFEKGQGGEGGGSISKDDIKLSITKDGYIQGSFVFVYGGYSHGRFKITYSYDLISKEPISDYVTLEKNAEGKTYLRANWLRTDKSVIKIVANDNGKFRDVIAFKRSDSDTLDLYVSLNDTKTDYVMSEKNGMLYKRYKADTNTNERTATKIYSEGE